jgi:hypothetical protein
MPYRRTLARFAAVAIALLAVASPAVSRAAPGGDDPPEGKPVIPPGLEDVGIREHLDGQIPMDAIFRDSTGRMVKLGDLFDGKSPRSPTTRARPSAAWSCRRPSRRSRT